MAEAAQHPRRGERRAAVRAQNEEEGRRTRQRLDDVEVRLDGMQSRLDQHDMRLGFLEAHIKVVIRGFDAVPEFLRARDNDFRLAKSAFIAAFIAELKENTGAEANAALAEAETLICDDNGLVVANLASVQMRFSAFSRHGLVLGSLTFWCWRPSAWWRTVRTSRIGFASPRAKAKGRAQVRATLRSLGGRARKAKGRAKRLTRGLRWLLARPSCLFDACGPSCVLLGFSVLVFPFFFYGMIG